MDVPPLIKSSILSNAAPCVKTLSMLVAPNWRVSCAGHRLAVLERYLDMIGNIPARNHRPSVALNNLVDIPIVDINMRHLDRLRRDGRSEVPFHIERWILRNINRGSRD